MDEKLIQLSVGIKTVLDKKHLENLISKAGYIISDIGYLKDSAYFFVTLKYQKKYIKYKVEIHLNTDTYGTVELWPMEFYKILIPRSKLKYKYEKKTIRLSDIKYGTLHRIWPITRYWQDVVQLNPVRVNLFVLLYGKLSNMLNKKELKNLGISK